MAKKPPKKGALSDRKNRKDEFYRRAKKAGFAARAVFKLEELDQKHKILSPGDRVCDLGCAPGSWLQYAARQVGKRGVMVGIDRFEIELTIPGLRALTGDVFTVDPADLLGELEAFDVVLSDMAPDTTGIRHVDQSRSEALFERALDIADATLAPGGHFVGKIFMGPDFGKLLTRCRQTFTRAKVVKPKGSRTQSIEQYIVGLGHKG